MFILCTCDWTDMQSSYESELTDRYLQLRSPNSKELCDGSKMRRSLTCHFNAARFHSRPVLLDPCLGLSAFSLDPLPPPTIQPVITLPCPLNHMQLAQQLLLSPCSQTYMAAFQRYVVISSPNIWRRVSAFSFSKPASFDAEGAHLGEACWEWYAE